jgi:hypothetical protein
MEIKQSLATADILRDIRTDFNTSQICKDEFLPFFEVDNSAAEEISSRALITHNIKSLNKLYSTESFRAFLGAFIFHSSFDNFLCAYLSYRTRCCDAPAHPVPSALHLQTLVDLDHLVRHFADACIHYFITHRIYNSSGGFVYSFIDYVVCFCYVQVFRLYLRLTSSPEAMSDPLCADAFPEILLQLPALRLPRLLSLFVIMGDSNRQYAQQIFGNTVAFAPVLFRGECSTCACGTYQVTSSLFPLQ